MIAMPELIPPGLLEQLLAAGRRRDDDPVPVLKIFAPDGGATWLICELGDDRDTMFGLCDLGVGDPELGYVSLAEIVDVRGGLGLQVERDLYWKPKHPISVYATAAREAGRIVDEPQVPESKP